MTTSPITRPTDAYLIDPQTKTIRVIKFAGIDLVDEIRKAIGGGWFEGVKINGHGDSVFVDDEACMAGRPFPTEFFLVDGVSSPLAGRGVVVGSTHSGEIKRPHVTREWLQDHVAWIKRPEPGRLEVEAPASMNPDRVRALFA